MHAAHYGEESRITSNPWLAFVRPNQQAKLRLFCFPYSGGGATAFRTWPDSLPTAVEVCPVQLPGRETRLREQPFTRISPLVQAAAQALLPHLDKPFALFGHSVGALIGFELARHLRRRYGLETVHLFVSGRHAPQIPDPDPPIYALPEPEFIEEVRLYNGTPEEVLENAELLELFIPILRADFAVNETYAYADEPPLDCPISAFGGLEDHKFSHDDLEAWREQTAASFSLQMFPGGHFFLHSARPLLLRAISQGLHQFVRRLT